MTVSATVLHAGTGSAAGKSSAAGSRCQRLARRFVPATRPSMPRDPFREERNPGRPRQTIVGRNGSHPEESTKPPQPLFLDGARVRQVAPGTASAPRISTRTLSPDPVLSRSQPLACTAVVTASGNRRTRRRGISRRSSRLLQEGAVDRTKERRQLLYGKGSVPQYPVTVRTPGGRLGGDRLAAVQTLVLRCLGRVVLGVGLGRHHFGYNVPNNVLGVQGNIGRFL